MSKKMTESEKRLRHEIAMLADDLRRGLDCCSSGLVDGELVLRELLRALHGRELEG